MNNFKLCKHYKLGLPSCFNLFFSAYLLTLAGCAAGPNYQRPAITLPEAYTTNLLETPTQSTDIKLGEQQRFIEIDLPAQWWELFHSQPLNDLVEASLENNPTLEAAHAALRLAWENVYAQEGFFYPTINAQFLPSRQKTARDLASNLASNAYYYSLYTLQIAVTYTADVFGANRRQVESLEAQANYQFFELRAAYLTLTSNVVNAAIQEAGLRGQIGATKEIIAIETQLTEMSRKLYHLGQISLADVVVQEAALAAAEAALPVLEKQLAIQRDLLKALSGRFPNDMHTAAFDLDSLQLPTDLPISFPSTLIENRPDIRAAEEQLHAASALIGVAVANRLPNVSLGTDLFGWTSTSLSNLFSMKNSFWQLMGDLTQPIYTGGTLEHREDGAWAAYDQAVAQYRATVLNAFQNVADSLQAIHLDAVALNAAAKAARTASQSLEIVRKQLGAGDVNILILWTAEQTYQQAFQNLVQAQTNRLTDTVALFQSLGGGWWCAESIKSPKPPLKQ